MCLDVVQQSFSLRRMGLGKQIRKYRERAGWTLEQLSALSEVDVGTISALEQRDSKRSQYTAQLAAAFGLTVEQLTDDSHAYPVGPPGTPAPQANSLVGFYASTPWPFSVSYARYAALPERDKGRIDGFMAAVADAFEASLKKSGTNGE